jgi:hypothetical protein
MVYCEDPIPEAAGRVRSHRPDRHAERGRRRTERAGRLRGAGASPRASAPDPARRARSRRDPRRDHGRREPRAPHRRRHVTFQTRSTCTASHKVSAWVDSTRCAGRRALCRSARSDPRAREARHRGARARSERRRQTRRPGHARQRLRLGQAGALRCDSRRARARGTSPTRQRFDCRPHPELRSAATSRSSFATRCRVYVTRWRGNTRRERVSPCGRTTREVLRLMSRDAGPLQFDDPQPRA